MQATTSSLPTSSAAARSTISSTACHLLPDRLCWWRPAGPTEETTLKRVLTATVRGAGTAPASVLSTGSLAPRKAELGRATRFSSLVAAPGHGGLISNHALTAVQPSAFAGGARPESRKLCALMAFSYVLCS